MRKGTVDAETGGGAPPYSTFDDKVKVVTPEGFGASFTDQKIRARFVKKVYLIILAQLAFTACVVAIFSHSQAVKQFFLTPSPNGYASSNGFILYITSYVVFFVTYIAIVCCEPVRRKHPGNIIVLCIFTLALSLMVGVISVFHQTEWVWMAMAITAALCLALTLFTFQTKWDFTGCAMYLWAFLWVVFIFGITAFVFWQTDRRILNAVWCGLIALVFSMYLVYNTQRILGGKKHSLSAEEHVYAATCIYIDIVQIFLAVLGLGRSS